jgi:hypothetical protein
VEELVWTIWAGFLKSMYQPLLLPPPPHFTPQWSAPQCCCSCWFLNAPGKSSCEFWQVLLNACSKLSSWLSNLSLYHLHSPLPPHRRDTVLPTFNPRWVTVRPSVSPSPFHPSYSGFIFYCLFPESIFLLYSHPSPLDLIVNKCPYFSL